MPIIQNYNINIGNAYAGMPFGLRTAMYIATVTDARESAAQACIMGGAVVAVANTVRGVQNAAASAAGGAVCYGVIERQINHEAASYPSTDGIMGSLEGDVLGMFREGQFMVKLSGAATRDQMLAYAGDGTWSGDSTKGFINVKAIQGGAIGDVVPAQIFEVATVAPTRAK